MAIVTPRGYPMMLRVDRLRAGLRIIMRLLVIIVCLVLVTSSVLLNGVERGGVQVRGYLTTPQELAVIRRNADRGVQPYAANVRAFLSQSGLATPTSWVEQPTISGSPQCSDGSQRDFTGRTLPRGPIYLIEGGRLTYAKLLVAYLNDDANYARDARRRILDLTDTHSWGGQNYSGGNQCILYLSWYVTSFIMAADLLEGFPTIWSADDKRDFQEWLARQVYPKAAWASRARTNNWGSGGSYAAAMIADYLHDTDLVLHEFAPQRLRLTPGQAYFEHTREQLSRMSTVVAQRDRADSRCLPRKGIQPDGGIPDELRRSQISLCNASHLPSASGEFSAAYTYQITHVETLIAHAELALRRGDNSLYDNVAADGSGSILQAIKFIIDNPANPDASHDWDEYRKAQLYVAYRYYRDPAIARQLPGGTIRGGDVITYGQVTHAFAAAENPAPPPVVAPPSFDDAPPTDPGDTIESARDLIVVGGAWQFDDGMYELSAPVRQDPGASLGNLALHPQQVTGDYVLTTRVQVQGENTDYGDAAIVFAYQDLQNYAYVSLNERNDGLTSGIFLLRHGVLTEIVDIATPITSDIWHTVRVSKTADELEVVLDGALIATAAITGLDDGLIGYGSLNDVVRFTPMQLTTEAELRAERLGGPDLTIFGGVWDHHNGVQRLLKPILGVPGSGLGNLALHYARIFGDFTLTARVQARESASTFNDVAIVFAHQDAQNYAYVSLNEQNDDQTSGIFVLKNGVLTQVADISVTIAPHVWYDLILVKSATTVTVLLNGEQVAEATGMTFRDGRVGYGALNNEALFTTLHLERDDVSSLARLGGSGVPLKGGTWAEEDQMYRLTTPNQGVPGTGLGNIALHPAPISGAFALTTRLLVYEAANDFSDVALVFGYQNPQTYAYVSLNEQNDGLTSGIFVMNNGVLTEVVDITYSIAVDTWHTVQLVQTETAVSLFLNGEQVATAARAAFGDGQVGYGSLNDAALFKQVRFDPLTPTSSPSEFQD